MRKTLFILLTAATVLLATGCPMDLITHNNPYAGIWFQATMSGSDTKMLKLDISDYTFESYETTLNEDLSGDEYEGIQRGTIREGGSGSFYLEINECRMTNPLGYSTWVNRQEFIDSLISSNVPEQTAINTADTVFTKGYVYYTQLATPERMILNSDTLTGTVYSSAKNALTNAQY